MGTVHGRPSGSRRRPPQPRPTEFSAPVAPNAGPPMPAADPGFHNHLPDHHHHHDHHDHRPGPGMTLPYSRVDSSLRALAGQAEGFGRFAVGGLHGAVYHVTSLADDGCGSLREACRRKEPLWIVFEISGVIHLSSYLRVSSYKTIDGRGHRIKLTGKGLQLKECEHVIICNLEFEGGRGPDVDGIQIKPNSRHIWIDRCSLCDYDDGLIDITRASTDITISRGPDVDGIQINPNSRHIWIDRCSLCDYDDGLIDITRASTDITISRCHFFQHDKTMLIGADPSHVGDRCIRVTIHHCFFDGTHQRHPRVRFGKVHLYNNYTRNWGIYAVCASVGSQILSQCNIYEAGQKKLAFRYLTETAADKDVAASGCIRSEGDLFVCGTQAGLQATIDETSFFKASDMYPTCTIEAPTDALKDVIKLCAGWQAVVRPEDTTVQGFVAQN